MGQTVSEAAHDSAQLADSTLLKMPRLSRHEHGPTLTRKEAIAPAQTSAYTMDSCRVSVHLRNAWTRPEIALLFTQLALLSWSCSEAFDFRAYVVRCCHRSREPSSFSVASICTAKMTPSTAPLRDTTRYFFCRSQRSLQLPPSRGVQTLAKTQMPLAQIIFLLACLEKPLCVHRTGALSLTYAASTGVYMAFDNGPLMLVSAVIGLGGNGPMASDASSPSQDAVDRALVQRICSSASFSNFKMDAKVLFPTRKPSRVRKQPVQRI